MINSNVSSFTELHDVGHDVGHYVVNEAYAKEKASFTPLFGIPDNKLLKECKSGCEPKGVTKDALKDEFETSFSPPDTSVSSSLVVGEIINNDIGNIDKNILIDTGRSRMWIVENFSHDIYSELKNISLYHEPPIIVMGRQCYQRRDVGFFSDESEGYKYSGQIMPSSPLSYVPVLKNLLIMVNKFLLSSFNGILINKYINGEKYISAHSDNENGLYKGGPKKATLFKVEEAQPLLPLGGVVASIAYGPGIRLFRIRNKHTKEIVLDYKHKPCTLIVMDGEFQKEFTHEIPIQKKIKDERISLTFRHHIE